MVVAVLAGPSPAAADARHTGAQGASTANGGSVAAYGISSSGTVTHRGGGASSIYCEIFRAGGTVGAGVTFGFGEPAIGAVEGDVVIQQCYDRATGTQAGAPRIITIGPAAAPVVSVQDLVALAMAQLDVEAPAMGISPDGGATLPHIDTWYWMTNTSSQSRSASAAGITATVTSTLDRLEVDAGSDGTATCPDGGTAYTSSAPARNQSSNCVINFNGPSRTATVVGTAVWHVTWSATTGESGDLGTVSRSTSIDVDVQELATVIRSQ